MEHSSSQACLTTTRTHVPCIWDRTVLPATDHRMWPVTPGRGQRLSMCYMNVYVSVLWVLIDDRATAACAYPENQRVMIGSRRGPSPARVSVLTWSAGPRSFIDGTFFYLERSKTMHYRTIKNTCRVWCAVCLTCAADRRVLERRRV